VATPVESVIAFAVVEVVSEKVPLAPVDGAVNVTVMPPAGVPFVVTVATSGTPNAASIAWLCGVPLVAAIATIGEKVLMVGL
jgi:adenine/guanine phosphoribosyltransferase-like PRPP-binding protein